MRAASSRTGARYRAAGWLAVLTVGWAPAIWAAESLASLLACRSIADPAARLACFDRETATLAAAGAETSAAPTGAASATTVTSPPAGATARGVSPSGAGDSANRNASSPASSARTEAAPAARSAVATSAEATQNFGLPSGVIAAKEVAAGQRPADLSRIEAHVTELSRAGDGRVVFTLDNGQIWLQMLHEGDLLLRPGDEVTIARGLFHSFALQTKSGRSCKVTRIR